MFSYVVRRLVTSLLVFVGITMVLFVLIQLVPGDPVEMMIDPQSFRGDRAAAIELRRAQLGLDDPLPIQYVHWVSEFAHGDFGYSYSSGQPVGDLIATRLRATVRLMSVALLIGLILGVPGGILAAVRRNSVVDYAISVSSLVAISVPIFFLSLVGIYVFGLKLQVLPTGGIGSPGGGFRDAIEHLILPGAILGVVSAGPWVRYTRAAMLETLGQDYLVTARAKGLSRTVVTVKHALRNALIPLITVLAIQVPLLISGAVVVEQVFSWPGMGRLALESVTTRDYPVLLGFVMVIAILVLTFNLLADVAYAVVDPRVRLGDER